MLCQLISSGVFFMRKIWSWTCQKMQKIYNWLLELAILKMAIVLIGIPLVYRYLGPWSMHISVIIIFLVIVLVFHKPLANLIGRVKSLSYKETRADFLPEQQRPLESKSLETELSATKDNIPEEEVALEKDVKFNSTAPEQLHDKRGRTSKESEVAPLENLGSQFIKPEEYYDGVNWIVKSKDQHIREFLERKYQKSDVEGGKSTDFIIENLAKAYVDIDFLRLKCSISPDQLDFLRLLNLGPLTVSYVKNYHSELLQRYQTTEAQYPFSSFIEWLCNSNLITEDRYNYQITYYGTSFLTFLVENRLS